MQNEKVPATQTDRDRAFPVMKRIYGERIAWLAKKGEQDTHHVVQAFAAHRLASTTAQSEAVQALVEALEWYADEVMAYSITQFNEPRSAVHEDRGKRARAALAAHRESQP